MKLLVKFIFAALAVWIAAYLVDGVTIDTWTTSAVVTVVMALLNLIVKPVIKILALPITIITLGLFTFVINAMIVLLCAHFVDGFIVDGWVSAIVYSIVLGLVNWVVGIITD